MMKSPTKNNQDVYVGDRVRFEDRHGTVLYVGEPKFAKKGQVMVGLCLDTKRSNSVNDGTVESTRYFRCKPGHAIFVGVDEVQLLDSSGEAGIGACSSPDR
jgi:dynactin complex subunit